jgi:hypothetical protein
LGLAGQRFALISGEEFKREVDALGGYDTSETGRLVARLGDTSG